MRDIHVLNQRMLAVILGAAAQSHSGNTNGNGNVGVCAAASGIPYSAAQIFDNTMKHVYQRQIGVLRTAGYVAQNLPRKGDTVLCLHGRKNIIEDITDDILAFTIYEFILGNSSIACGQRIPRVRQPDS